jgi:hypothetical protein
VVDAVERGGAVPAELEVGVGSVFRILGQLALQEPAATLVPSALDIAFQLSNPAFILVHGSLQVPLAERDLSELVPLGSQDLLV